MKQTKQLVVVLAVISDGNGKFLIDLRNDENNQEHNKWELPGGKVDFGEDPKTALKREILEEIGVYINIVQLLPTIYSNVWHYPGKDVHVVLIGYLCRIIKGIPKPSNDEVSEIKWIFPDKIRSLLFLPFADSFIFDAERILHTVNK